MNERQLHSKRAALTDAFSAHEYLESAVARCPTSPARDLLTTANIFLETALAHLRDNGDAPLPEPPDYGALIDSLIAEHRAHNTPAQQANNE